MKAVLERIEYNWWNFHIKVLDESLDPRDPAQSPRDLGNAG